MITFVKRLTKQQFCDFFEDAGTIYNIQSSLKNNKIEIFFRDKNGKSFKYSVTDTYLFAPGYCKSSEDWKFYLLELFGEEYLKKCGETPVENEFVSQLSYEDVRILLQTNELKVILLQEKEAFRKGTRRFNVQYNSSFYQYHEVVIGPHIEYCSGMIGVTEKIFMKYFTRKFGLNFISYYTNIEKKNCEKKVEEYRKKCESQVSTKQDYMISIWEKV